jgi:site-specific recombinase
MVAAWADNWSVCHHISEALQKDQRLVRILGPSRAARLGLFWKRNIAGLAGNISFGFMLGLIPEFAEFAGLPLDIRHVTLSSAMLAAGTASLGPSVMATWPFWLGVVGIAVIGLMNLTVSFSLAMFVAIKAREIEAPERHAIYRALGGRLRRKPLSFILPLDAAPTIASPAAAPQQNL